MLPHGRQHMACDAGSGSLSKALKVHPCWPSAVLLLSRHTSKEMACQQATAVRPASEAVPEHGDAKSAAARI